MTILLDPWVSTIPVSYDNVEYNDVLHYCFSDTSKTDIYIMSRLFSGGEQSAHYKCDALACPKFLASIIYYVYILLQCQCQCPLE